MEGVKKEHVSAASYSRREISAFLPTTSNMVDADPPSTTSLIPPPQSPSHTKHTQNSTSVDLNQMSVLEKSKSDSKQENTSLDLENGTLVRYDPKSNIKQIIDPTPAAKDSSPDTMTSDSTAEAPKKSTASSGSKSNERDAETHVSLSVLTREELGNMSDSELEKELAAFDDEGNASLDDDEADVYLQELGINFGLSGRSSRAGPSRVSSRTKLGPGISRGELLALTLECERPNFLERKNVLKFT